MPRRTDSTLATAGDRGRTAAAPGGRVLLVVGAGHLSTHALEPDSVLVLGRDATCDIAIDHPKISRRHAIVRGDHPATVEDAGGTNRVHLGARTLAAGEVAPLPPGGSFQIGPVTALVLGVASPIGESAEGRAALVVRDVRAGALTDLIVRVAASDVSVLIRGETGTGKEVLAHALHVASGRTGPMLALNCAALSETLLESELFGHERGAFTGAVQAKPGLFESAAGGTVFLDEVADLPPSVQAKLLRAIESRAVLRLGGVRPVQLDVRFLAATHKDLRAAVAAGRFRQDLYFRINGITIVVMPLRDRKDMIPALATEFLAAAVARGKRPAPALTPEAMTVLARHDWPGNVRELKAAIERAVLLAPGDAIGARHIVIDSAEPDDDAADAADAGPGAAPAGDADDDPERVRIIAALERCAGNQTRAAKLLGISRATLSTKLAVFRIPRPRK